MPSVGEACNALRFSTDTGLRGSLVDFLDPLVYAELQVLTHEPTKLRHGQVVLLPT
jgi:hypothetical protein